MFERLAEEESKTKAAVVAGEQPADTEMEDERRTTRQGAGRRWGQSTASLSPAPVAACLPCSLPYSTLLVLENLKESGGCGVGGKDPW